MIILDRPAFVRGFSANGKLSMARTPSQFVKHEVASNLEQPSGEFCPRHITTSAFPNANKYLLSNVFNVGIASQHPSHGSGDQTLMSFYDLLECGYFSSCDELHQPNVFGVFLNHCR